MIRAVLFDAGNTLLFLDLPRMAEGVSTRVGLAVRAEQLEAVAAEAALAMEHQEGTDRDRASRYLMLLFRLAGVPEDRMLEVRHVLWQLHHERHLWSRVDPLTSASLDRMAAHGLRLGVVSNSDGRVESALEAAKLRHHFEVVVDSLLVGFEKPDPRIFTPALERLGVAPDEALYVGDLYEIDVIGARRAGLDAALLDPAGRHERRDVPTFRSIARLTDALLGGRWPVAQRR
ncbi:MAG: HAD family hydrolase [Gemmatimonadota bacterium]